VEVKEIGLNNNKWSHLSEWMCFLCLKRYFSFASSCQEKGTPTLIEKISEYTRPI